MGGVGDVSPGQGFVCAESCVQRLGRVMQGLKRLSEDAMKELYPATTDEWAGPVASDDEEMSLIRPLLAQTSIETAPLRLAYDADAMAWTPDAFHGAVNTFGAAVVISKTVGGAIVGGYNPQGMMPQGMMGAKAGSHAEE
jgi:hypothetical protein